MGKERVGWIGLGKMGTPMSKNLLKAGYPLIIYNRTIKKTKELADMGAEIADTPRSLAANVDVILSMISDDSALEAVSLGTNGVFEGAKTGAFYIDMSTVSPSSSHRVAQEADRMGINYLRAPVSGSTAFAEDGTLMIFVSGSKEAYERCLDILGALGQKVFHVGYKEEARYLKLLINMMVGITSAMVAEALVFGKRAGMDWNRMIDIINSSVAASPSISYKTQMLKSRDFTPAFTINQMAKDFDMALDTGRALDIPLPITGLVRQFFGGMKAKGKGELDFFGLITLMEEIAGISIS